MRDTSSFTDEQLLDLLAQGDADAFTEIYGRYWKLLFYVAVKRLHNHTEAEEAVQNIFLDLWARRKSIIIKRSVKYYLAAAVQYQVLNFFTRRKLTQRLEFDGKEPATDSTSQYLSFHELEKQLTELVDALPEKCRLVYRLSREEQLSNKTIASHLGISEKTVENQLTKALARIRAGLGHTAWLVIFI